MTIVYFDASAFVKLLVEEDGSDVAAELWDGADAVVSSRLAYAEVRAALAAADRAGRLVRADRVEAEAVWETLWDATRVVEVTAAVTRRAGDLAGTYALGGADAVHLASVLAIDTDARLFAVWDQRLRLGAQAAGVWTAPS